MNKTLEGLARTSLKIDLKHAPEALERAFKRAFSPENLSLDINTIIDNIPHHKLSLAMDLVDG